jgi:hypothetical protein
MSINSHHPTSTSISFCFKQRPGMNATGYISATRIFAFKECLLQSKDNIEQIRSLPGQQAAPEALIVPLYAALAELMILLSSLDLKCGQLQVPLDK